MKKMIALLIAVMMLVSFGTLAIADETQEIEEVTEVIEVPEVAEVAETEENAEEDPMAVIELPEDQDVDFTGTISVSIRFEGEELYYGDTVTLHASVKDANLDYSIRWEARNNEGSWNKVGTGADYSFAVTEENADLAYRAVLVVC